MSDSEAVGPALQKEETANDGLGKVASPPNKESTSDFFYCWVERDKLLERTQIVHAECEHPGEDGLPRPVTYVGLVEEVYRQSRQKDMGEEYDRYDGSLSGREPPFRSEGFSFARVITLRTDPVVHAPPNEECTVKLGGAVEAAIGYGLDRMPHENKLNVGRLRNGGTKFAGPAVIDTAYLLGENGGHLNVNGIAGMGTKSSFLLHVNKMLLDWAARSGGAGDLQRTQIVPIIFNVKNFDLFWIDRWNKGWNAERRDEWKGLGVEEPVPFKHVQFFASREAGKETPVDTGRDDVKPYSWGLEDVIEKGLFRYLFAEEDVGNANFSALVGSIEETLTDETPAGLRLRRGEDFPTTFDGLADWIKNKASTHELGDPHPGTKAGLVRRLRALLIDADGVLRRKEPKGSPLVMPGSAEGPIVIDLNGASDEKSKRFVVATVFHQLVQKRSSRATQGLRYVVTLDELNRFAPRDGGDAITRMIERVAAEMRSQGIILLGAQQEASRVKPRVIENCAVKAVGRSGTVEMSADVWRFLDKSSKKQAEQLQQDEKLLMLPGFRAPMLAKIPFPPWALRREEAIEVDPTGAPIVRKSLTARAI
jgi:hypothetical protein